VFLEIEERAKAIEFFTTFYSMPKLPFYDYNGNVRFEREMRAYLIKTEGDFERLAVIKY
jgi:hypothetical protein